MNKYENIVQRVTFFNIWEWTDNDMVYIDRNLNLDYSRAEANPPLPFIKVEEAACEGVVFYVEQAATKPML